MSEHDYLYQSWQLGTEGNEMNKGDTNIDHQDMLMAQGAFDDDQDQEQLIRNEYDAWLEETYAADRRKRMVEQKKVRF